MRKLIIGLSLVTFVLFVYTSHATVVKQDKQKTQVTAEKKADTKTAKTTTTGDKKCADKKDCKKDSKCCKDKGTKACCKKDGKKCDAKDTKKESTPKK